MACQVLIEASGTSCGLPRTFQLSLSFNSVLVFLLLKKAGRNKLTTFVTSRMALETVVHVLHVVHDRGSFCVLAGLGNREYTRQTENHILDKVELTGERSTTYLVGLKFASEHLETLPTRQNQLSYT